MSLALPASASFWVVGSAVINGTMTPEAGAQRLQTGLDSWYHPAK